MINKMIKSDYHDKGVEFSGSDFSKPLYQLWVSKNFPKNETTNVLVGTEIEGEQSFKAWVGQLIHKASYDFPEVNVIKEYSPVTEVYIGNQEYVSVGGSIDRITIDRHGYMQLEDIKTQGNFPAKASWKEPSESWIQQLSVYRYLLECQRFKTSDVGIIHQYVMGYQKDKKNEDYHEYNKIEIPLMSVSDTEEMIKNKIDIATGDEPILKDCKDYMCKDYCSYNQVCPHYNKGGNS